MLWKCYFLVRVIFLSPFHNFLFIKPNYIYIYVYNQAKEIETETIFIKRDTKKIFRTFKTEYSTFLSVSLYLSNTCSRFAGNLK